MGRFTPPLVFTTETKDVIICFSGGGGVQARPLHKPLRQATKGQFSIYGSFDNADTSIVIAMSFEEDKLPVLGRQTYYHFLDPSDFFWDEKGWIEFGLHNYIATTTEKEYQKLVSWKANLGSNGVTEAVQKIVTQLRSPADKLFRVSELPRDTREALYFNLRASLVDLPVPKELGSAGHWQRPTASGTPQIMPYVEREYRNRKLEEWEIRDQLEETHRLEVEKVLTKPVNQRSWEELALLEDPGKLLAPESLPSSPGESGPDQTLPERSEKAKIGSDYPSPPSSLDNSPPRDKKSTLIDGSFHTEETSSNTLSLVGAAEPGALKTKPSQLSPDRKLDRIRDNNSPPAFAKSGAFGNASTSRPKALSHASSKTDLTVSDTTTSDFPVFDDAGRPMGMISLYQGSPQGNSHFTFLPRTTGTAIQVNTGTIPIPTATNTKAAIDSISRDQYASPLRKALEGTGIYRKASALSNGNGKTATSPGSASETGKNNKNPKEPGEISEWEN